MKNPTLWLFSVLSVASLVVVGFIVKTTEPPREIRVHPYVWKTVYTKDRARVGRVFSVTERDGILIAIEVQSRGIWLKGFRRVEASDIDVRRDGIYLKMTKPQFSARIRIR